MVWFSKSTIKLTDSQYKEIFMYSSAGDYLKLFHNDETLSISKELEKLPQDYISSINIPFSELLNSEIVQNQVKLFLLIQIKTRIHFHFLSILFLINKCLVKKNCNILFRTKTFT